MARLQVMHLPAPPDEYPFVLVIDQAEPSLVEYFTKQGSENIRNVVGARAVLCFPETVEVI